MICAACQGKMMRKSGDLDLKINGELYIVHNVTFEECATCGEKVIGPRTGETIYERTHMKQFKKSSLTFSYVYFKILSYGKRDSYESPVGLKV